MADKVWLGDAAPVQEVQTLTPGGTIGTETFTVTRNNKVVEYTAQGGDAVADVVAGLVAALNDIDAPPEFQEMTAIDSTTHVTLTTNESGKPATVTSSASGSATLVQATTTAATGPHHFGDIDNWSGNSLPVDADNIIFDSRARSSLLYGLDQNGITPAAIIVKQSFGNGLTIGLPEINRDNPAGAYVEDRQRYLKLGNSGDAQTISLTVGEGEGAGSGRVLIDTNTAQTVATITGTGQAEEEGVPSFCWKGTHASNEINVSKGDVGISFFSGESATVATLRCGHLGDPVGDSSIDCGDGATITTVEMNGGRVTANSNITTVTMTDGELDYRAGALTTLNMDAGICRYRSTGTLTMVKVGSGANLDFRYNQQKRTVTNCELYEGFEYHDPFGTVEDGSSGPGPTNGLDFVRCTPNDGTLDIKPNQTLTISAI